MPLSSQATASPSIMRERERSRAERLDDQREAVGQVIAGAAVELHPCAILSGDDAEAVVLDLVQPQRAGGRSRRFRRQARRDEPAGRVRGRGNMRD